MMKRTNAFTLLLASALSLPFGSVSAQVSGQQQRQTPAADAKTSVDAVRTFPTETQCYSLGLQARAASAVLQNYASQPVHSNEHLAFLGERVRQFTNNTRGCQITDTEAYTGTEDRNKVRFERAVNAVRAGNSSRTDSVIVDCIVTSDDVRQCSADQNSNASTSAVGGTGQGSNTNNTNNTNLNGANVSTSNITIRSTRDFKMPHYSLVGQEDLNMSSSICPSLKLRDAAQVMAIRTTKYKDDVTGKTFELSDYRTVAELKDILECKP